MYVCVCMRVCVYVHVCMCGYVWLGFTVLAIATYILNMEEVSCTYIAITLMYILYMV